MKPVPMIPAEIFDAMRENSPSEIEGHRATRPPIDPGEYLVIRTHFYRVRRNRQRRDSISRETGFATGSVDLLGRRIPLEIGRPTHLEPIAQIELDAVAMRADTAPLGGMSRNRCRSSRRKIGE
jgi:hypothetical protein